MENRYNAVLNKVDINWQYQIKKVVRILISEYVNILIKIVCVYVCDVCVWCVT